MNKQLEALERKLEIRNRELTEAHSHIEVAERVWHDRGSRVLLVSDEKLREMSGQEPSTRGRPSRPRKVTGKAQASVTKIVRQIFR